MIWFWLTILYVVFQVTAELINKKTISHEDIDEVIFGASVQIATGIIAFILAISTGWRFNFTSSSIFLILLMIPTYLIAVRMYFTGLKRVDLSLATIFASVGSVWSLILGIVFLSEPLLLTKIIGVALILAAAFVVSVKGKKITLNSDAWLVLGSSFFYALGAVFDKQLNAFGSPLSYIVISFGTVGLTILAAHYKRTIQALHGTFRNPKYWKGVLLNGAFYSFGFWSLFEAYQRGGEVSRMFPITLSTSLLVPVLGIVVLKERENITRKIAAVIILIVGLWFIKG